MGGDRNTRRENTSKRYEQATSLGKHESCKASSRHESYSCHAESSPSFFRHQPDIYIRQRHLNPALCHTLRTFPLGMSSGILNNRRTVDPPRVSTSYRSGSANSHTLRLQHALRPQSTSVITIMDETRLQMHRF